MKEKEIFKQLHNLSNMKPDASWKSQQRDIMLKQIGYSESEANKAFSARDFLGLPLNMLQSISQPVMATFLVAFLLLTSGFVGLRASQDSKPGDSLYAAKIIGEKTQLALTFSDKKKAQLVLEFAVKRAEELKRVASESKDSSDEEKVVKLAEGLKKDINDARERLERISMAESKDVASKEEAPVEDIADETEITTQEEPEQEVFSAGSARDENGLELSKSEKTTNEEIKDTESASVTALGSNTPELASGTEEIASTSIESVEEEAETPEDILDQASSLLEEQNYDEVLNALSNAGNAFNETYDKGEVKGAEESVDGEDVGTSTQE